MIRGHPSPHGFELSGSAIGTVALERLVTGERCAAGDALIGLPSSGLHSNGYTLARALAAGRPRRPSGAAGGRHARRGAARADRDLRRAALALLRSTIAVHGLAHITGDGLLNLKRLNGAVGFEIDAPLPVPGICEWLCEAGAIDAAQAHQIFNMGCGFIAVVAPADADAAAALLAEHHPGARVIGHVSDAAGTVTLPGLGIVL